MLRIAICDDNPGFLDQLHATLTQWPAQPDQMSIDHFSNGNSLIESHSRYPFHFLFIDMMMPALNGIETAREIRLSDSSAKIVFLTHTPEYAVESYKVKASNYLLKPLDAQELYACLDELEEQRRQSARAIPVRTASGVRWLELDQIAYLEAQNKIVQFALTDGAALFSIDPLYVHTGKLSVNDGFFKCHRSYVVNIQQIETYTHKEIRMRSGVRIPISRSCSKEFEQAFFDSVFGGTGGD